ncbi:MAG TPA: hypothetical protein VFU19_19885 [Iamia sp.]|nr:hypothetical protein [Iamia sp.]
MPDDETERMGDGAVATDGPDAPDAPFDPSTIRDPLPQPLFSLRRLVIVAVLAVAVLCLYVAGRSGGDTDPAATGATTAIESYQPSPGGRVLRQSEVGVVLKSGYDGRISIDGIAIPEEQMVGAIDESNPEYDPETGPRPNNKTVVKYQPGPGKAVTEYATGAVEVTIRYWRIADGPDAARTTTYTVRVF